MGILLAYSGADDGFKNFEAVPPLGLLALYSALPQEYRDQTKLLDGILVDTDYMTNWIESNRPEIVAISSLTFGYQNAIKIAEAARANGAISVLGGRHATDVRDNITRRMSSGERPFDFLVSGEGESIFRKLVQDFYERGRISPQRNLLSPQSSGQISIRSEKKSGVDETFPVLDYSLLTDESAPERYMERLERIGILRDCNISMPIITQRGCAYMGKRHCTFCSIPEVNPKIPHDVFEKSLESLLINTNADHVWFTEGDHTPNIKHVRAVSERVKSVKNRICRDFVIYCFTRSDDLLRGEIIDVIYDMGVRAVFIGYEHGNNEILKKMQKHTTREQNLEATRRIAEKGIEVTCAGIVLGTAPETRQTLQEAISLAEDLAKIGNVRSIFSSPVYAFPGAPLWLNEFLPAVSICYGEKAALEIAQSDILEEELLLETYQEVAHKMPHGAPKTERPTLDEIREAKRTIDGLLGSSINFTPSF